MWTMDDGNEVTSRSVVSANNKPSIFTHIVPDITNNHSSSKVTTRWSPTAEQLMGLEELYRHGTRTPTALQIQEITAKLRRFGNIEGKNVFYWFQNHKARDKKKQRLKLEAQRRQLFDHNHSKAKPVTQKVTTLHLHNPKPEPLSNCSTISEESGTAVPRATGHSRLVQADKELKLIKREEDKHYVSPFKPYMETPFCFPIINGNGITWPNTLVSMATTPGLSFFTDIYGNNNIRESDNDIETLDLFPLRTESLSVATDDHQHDYDLGAANCDLSLA